MAPLYQTTVVALLVTSTVLVSAAPVYDDKANMLDKLVSLLDRTENQEQAQMTRIRQTEADNEDQEDLLSQMILEMLMNKLVEKESATGLQEDKQAEEQTLDQQDKEEMTFIQNMYDKLNNIEKEAQEIAQVLKEKERLLKIQDVGGRPGRK